MVTTATGQMVVLPTSICMLHRWYGMGGKAATMTNNGGHHQSRSMSSSTVPPTVTNDVKTTSSSSSSSSSPSSSEGLSYVNDANESEVRVPVFREVPPPPERERLPLWRMPTATAESFRSNQAARARDVAIMKDVGGANFLERYDQLIQSSTTLLAGGTSDSKQLYGEPVPEVVRRAATPSIPKSSEVSMALRLELQTLADQRKFDELMDLFQ
jgi:hypothetical protein